MPKSPLFLRKQAGGVFLATDESETTGEIFFVNSVTGTNSVGAGRNPDAPLATIDYAIGLCTADKGDRIYVMPGHAETIIAAGGITADVAGISIIGLGNGSNRPTITMGTAATATFLVSALNVKVRNIVFTSAIDSLETFLSLTAGDTEFEDCKFVTASTFEALCFVNMATTKDNFYFRRCEFWQPTDPDGTDDAAATGCFYFVDSENIFIEDCFFYGQFETAIFHNKTTAAKNVWVRNCFGTQLLATGLIYTQVAAMEGGNLNCTWNHRTAADVTEATWTGTLSANFVVDVNSGVLADGAAGGQYAAPGTAANS